MRGLSAQLRLTLRLDEAVFVRPLGQLLGVLGTEAGVMVPTLLSQTIPVDPSAMSIGLPQPWPGHEAQFERRAADAAPIATSTCQLA